MTAIRPDDQQLIRKACRDEAAYRQVMQIIGRYVRDDNRSSSALPTSRSSSSSSSSSFSSSLTASSLPAAMPFEAQSKKTEALERFTSNLKQLHQIAVQSYTNLDQMFTEYLKAGGDMLGLEMGIISQIYESTQEYIVMAVVSPDESIRPGTLFSLGDTYCSSVMHERQTVTFTNVGILKHMQQHPVYVQNQFESYIGTPIWVEGEIFGTLNFESTRVRHNNFNEFEIELIEIMARDVGNAILARREEQKRQQAEERLLAREMEFRALFELNNDAVFILSPEGIIRRANEQAAAMLGYSLNDMVGTRASFYTKPEEADDSSQQYDRLFQTGRLPIYERTFIHQDGREIPTEINAALVRDEMGNPRHVQSIVRDLTERKRAERAHRESEANLRSILDSTSQSFTLIDRHHHIVLMNRVARENAASIFGRQYTPGESIFHYVLDEVRDNFERVYNEALYGVQNTVEYTLATLAGERRHFEFGFYPVTVEDGQIIGVCMVTEDVTERHISEKRLLAAKQEAERANRSKSMFLANMSHELRTPLNAIIGFAQLLDRDPVLQLTQQEYISLIMRSGEHLLQLINDILEVSKIEAGRVELNPTDFDLHELLEGMESVFRAQADNKMLDLTFRMGDDLPRFIQGDKGKLRQILFNLLSNAIKFTDTGEVSLTAYGKSTAPDDAGASNQADDDRVRLYFEVRDTGRGISVDDMNKLFRPFVQTDAGIESQQGTGLGLTISQQFAHLMQGDIHVSSEVGVGTLFTVELVMQLSHSEYVPSRRHAPRVVGLKPGQPAYRILVVDDKVENRLIVRRMMENVGFEVREAMNGQEAVDIWRTWHPHLIWMDMRMPVMDGYEATNLIKQETQEPVVVVALTASALSHDRDIVMAVGCDDFVAKPFRENEMYDCMVKHLGVQFVYENDTRQQSAASMPLDENNMEAITAAVGALPAHLRSRLRRVADDLDITTGQEVAAQIEQYNAALADQLIAWLQEFSFEKIIAVLNEVEEIS